MKKVLKKIVIYFLGLCSILLGLFLLTGFLSSNHRLGTTKIKQKRISGIKLPKVILVGGSSLHYGIHSEYLEKELKMPVVNMGIQGSIGLRYMLEEVIEKVNEDDIIILLAEHAHYYNLDIDGETTLYNLLSKHPEGIKYLTPKQILNLQFFIGPVIKDNFLYIFQRIIRKLKKQTETIFNQTNEWGDYIGHKDQQTKYKPPTGLIKSFTLSEKTFSYLQKIQERIGVKKAKFFIGFAPIAESEVNVELFSEIDNQISKLFGEIKLGSINSYTLPDNYFYDTGHHLLFEKRVFRTKMLIQDIQNNDVFVNSIQGE